MNKAHRSMGNLEKWKLHNYSIEGLNSWERLAKRSEFQSVQSKDPAKPTSLHQKNDPACKTQLKNSKNSLKKVYNKTYKKILSRTNFMCTSGS